MKKVGVLVLLWLVVSIDVAYAQCVADAGSNETICEGQSVQLGGSPTASGGNAPYTYLWSNGSTTPNPNVSPTTTTTYRLTVVDADSCIDQDQMVVTVKPRPNAPAINFSPNNACAGTPINFSINVPQFGVSYSWTFQGGGSGSGTSVTHSFDVTGNGTVARTATVKATLNGCTRSASVSVQVKRTPDASLFIDPGLTNCVAGGGVFNISADNISATNNSDYTISWGDNSQDFNSTGFTSESHSYVSQGYFNLTFTVTGQNGCQASNVYRIFNGSNPGGSITGPPGTINLCPPFELTYPINGVQDNPPGTIYIITSNDGTPADTLQHPPPATYSHIFDTTSCGAANPLSVPNSFYIRMRIQNPCGFSLSYIEPVTLASKPEADFTVAPDTIVCLNSTATFTNTSIPANNVDNFGTCTNTTKKNWLISPASGWNIVSGTLGQDPPSNNPTTWGSDQLQVSFSQPGRYQVKLFVEGAHPNVCGKDSIIKTVCVQSPPNADYDLPIPNACVPVIATAQNLTNLPTCGQNSYNWDVSFSGNNCPPNTADWSFSGGTGASSENPAFEFNSAGTYQITLTASNQSCPPSTSTSNFQIKDKPVVLLGALGTICKGESVNPSATVYNCYVNTGPSYSWTFDDGSPPTSNSANPGAVTFNTSGTKTITLIVTNECGSITATTTVTVLDPPQADAGADQVICSATTVSIGTTPQAGNSYSWSPTAGLSDSSIANPTVTLTNTGNSPVNHTYILTSGFGNCLARDTVIVTVYPLATATAGPDQTTCTGQLISLSGFIGGAASSATWTSDNGGTFGGASDLNTTYTPPTNYSGDVILTLTTNDPAGPCPEATSSLTVSVLDPPMANAGNDVDVCSGSPASIGTLGQSGYSYQWSPSQGLDSTITANPNVTLTNSGGSVVTTTYWLTVSANSCTSTDSVDVSVYPEATADAGQPQSVCADSSVILNGTIGGSATSGSWSSSQGTFSNSNLTTTFNPTISSGTATVTLTTDDPAGPCPAATSIVDITVNAIPTITNSLSQSVCSGEATVAVNWTSNAGSGVTYNWSGSSPHGITNFPVSGSGNIQSFTPTNPGTTPGTIIYTVTPTTSGCSAASIDYTFTVNPSPTADQPAPQTICSGQSTQSVTLSSNISGAMFSWTTTAPSVLSGYSDGNGSTIPGQSLSNTGSTAEDVTYTITPSFNGCDGPLQTFTVTVNPSPDIIFSIPDQNICSGSSTQQVDLSSSTPGVTLSWTATQPAGITGVATSGTTTIPTQTLVNATNSPITVTYTANATTGGGVACSGNTQSYSVTVNPIPVASANPTTDTICSSAQVNIGLNGSIGGTSFNWTVTHPGSISGAQDGSGNSIAQTLINNSSTTQSVSYDITPVANNCNGQPITVIIVVNPSPEITFDSSRQEVCTGGTSSEVTLISSTSGATFSWTSNANGVGGVAVSGTNIIPVQTLTNSGTAPVDVIYNATAKYAGCSGQPASYIITVNPLPTVEAGPDFTLCNQPIADTLQGYSPTSGGTGEWTGSNNVTPTGVFTPNETDTLLLYYTFTDTNNCVNRDSTTIKIIDPVQATAGNDFSVCITDSAVDLDLQQSPFPSPGDWAGNGVNSNIFNPSIATSGDHVIIYSTGSGTCLTMDSIEVTVHPQPVFSVTDTSTCIGDSIDLFASESILDYNWTPATSLSIDTGHAVVAFPDITTNYSVIGTNTITGCKDTVQSEIVVNSLPVVEAGNNLLLCNQPIPETLQGYSPTSGGTGEWTGANNVTTAGVFTPAGLDTVTLYYTFTDNNGCENFDSIEIKVIDPVIAEAGPDTALCLNDPVIDLNGWPNGGRWSGKGIIDSTQGTFDPAVADSGTHMLYYSIGTGTCLNKDSMQLTVHALPSIDFVPPSPETCEREPVSLVVNSSATMLEWSPDTFLSANTGNTVTAILDSTQIFTVTATDGNGCVNYKDVTVTVHPLPEVDAGDSLTLCNQPLPYSLTGHSPTTNGTGEWSGPNVTPNGIFTPPVDTGIYSITYTFTDNHGCTDSGSRVITVTLPVFADAGNDVTVCLNNGLDTLTGFSPINGFWQGPGIIDSSLGVIDPLIARPGLHSLVYNFGESTCRTTDTILYRIHPIPAVDFAYSATCIGETTYFSDQTNANADSIISWHWDFGDGETDSIQNPSHVYANNGNYVATLTTFNSNGCYNDTTIQVVIHPLPTVSFTSPDVECPDSNVTFILDTIDAATYEWDFGDGHQATGINPQHSYSDDGTFTIQLTATTSFGCIDSAFATISILEAPKAFFHISPDSGCGPLKVEINPSLSVNFDAFRYKWVFGNGDYSFRAIPPIVTYTTGYLDTTYYLEFWVYSDTCQTLDVMRDTIRVFAPPRARVLTDVTNGCGPLHVQITNDTRGRYDSIKVDFGDGASQVYDTLTSVTQTFENNGITDLEYMVKLYAFNKCGWEVDSVTLTVYPNTVEAGLDVSPSSACRFESFKFTNNSSGATFVHYDFGDGNTLSSPDFTVDHSYSNSGDYTVFQHIYSGDSCSYDFDSVKITVHESPISDFDAQQKGVECTGPIEVTFTNYSTGADSYSWDFGDNNSDNVMHPVHVYELPGSYDTRLISENSFGCRDTLPKAVIVKHRDNILNVPNAFSPEYHTVGVNVFKPKGTCLQSYLIEIFNPWGERVWFSNEIFEGQPADGWNGFYQGELAPQDVYVWKIIAVFQDGEVWSGKGYDTGRKNIGTVTLIR